ncbi:MAG: hypothetical protein LBG22_10600, partial [Treponema sp.]|nr:hypothetical protein [Treponema sp.]
MRLSLKSRIFILYSLLFLITITVIITLLSVYMFRNITNQMQISLDVFSNNTAGQVAGEFDRMNGISSRFFFNREILNIMTGVNAAGGASQNYFDTNFELSKVIYQNFIIVLGVDLTKTIINLFTENAFLSTYNGLADWRAISSDAKFGILAEAKRYLDENPGLSLVMGPHKAYWAPPEVGSGEYYSLSRKLYDVYNDLPAGYLQILKKKEEIEKIFDSSDDTVQIYLYDNSCRIVNPPPGEGTAEAQSLLEKLKASSGSGGVYKGGLGKNYIVSLKDIENYNYGILIMQHYHSGFFMVYFSMIAAVALILLVIIISLNFLISHYLTRPLGQIIKAL